MEFIDLLSYYDEVLALWQEYTGEEFCAQPPIMPTSGLKNSLLFVGLNPSFTKGDDTPYTLSQDNRGGHPYFATISRMAERIGMPWSHLDLLCIRETDQRRIRILLRSDKGCTFIQKQIDITLRMINALNPAAIVICNALACRLLDERMHLSDQFDEQIGTPQIHNIPWDLCGMLSGQRALDKGSRERLIWHISRNRK